MKFGVEIDEEVGVSFLGIIFCNSVVVFDFWNIDLGVIDYMIVNMNNIINFIVILIKFKIYLFNGDVFFIVYIGNVELNNDLIFYKVMYVFLFKYNLFFVDKFVKDFYCIVIFFFDFFMVVIYNYLDFL